ncbi:dihydropteroate synthase [Acidicapsa acidisoli]|uniref:dihydropteroate synthase n=1 Tax=Acidicapsa acidisoli TaxID=1615681 RepID=UPI0021DFE799|nr:dihydropteroate synthase [Acidicapsa acidisoli]
MLQLGSRTLVMGVVNVTPDSFSDGGLYLDTDLAISHALRLLDEGADLLDLGAESTRPDSHAGEIGSAAVSAEEEQARLLPVLEGVMKARPEAVISVDTYKSATARAAVNAGAQIVNDVSGFTWDSQMAATCVELACGVVLMHTLGMPEEWKTQPALERESVLSLVRDGLLASLRAALDAGIPRGAIVLDPGYGFGKRFDENYDLLARQSELLSLGCPLLAGVSRKSFLVRTLAESKMYSGQRVTEEARETASIAALAAAILHGASIVRVHQVKAAVEAAAIADAVLAAR